MNAPRYMVVLIAETGRYALRRSRTLVEGEAAPIWTGDDMAAGRAKAKEANRSLRGASAYTLCRRNDAFRLYRDIDRAKDGKGWTVVSRHDDWAEAVERLRTAVAARDGAMAEAREKLKAELAAVGVTVRTRMPTLTDVDRRYLDWFRARRAAPAAAPVA